MQKETLAKRKTVFSGIQSTGVFTLANYIGAIQRWPKYQDDYDCIYCIVDQHAITVRQNPEILRQKTLEGVAMVMASGIDIKKSILYIQSHVAAHAQAAWVLNCYAQFGELSRMTQFKDKSAKNADNINAGLFTYPCLMAADILLYDTDIVPVGEDQKQHVELARDIVKRFNGIHGEIFTLPEPHIAKIGARIMSLQEPEKKMSKSGSNPNAIITLLDDDDSIMKKFKRAVTDSEGVVRYGEGKNGINNLMSIMSVLSGDSLEQIEKEFDGKGYGDFKKAVAEIVIDKISPIRDEYNRLMSDKGYLLECCKDGAERAEVIANATLRKIYDSIGFVLR